MTTVLRRILAAALIAALAGLGVIAAFLGRRPRTRVAHQAKAWVPAAAPQPITRQARGGRGFAVALVCLLLLAGVAGVVYENRDADPAIGHRAPEGAGKPLAALSPPDTGTPRTPAPAGETPGETVRTLTPGPSAGPPPSPPAASPTPDFDIVRVEPNGDAVIAGRAAPDADVEALVNGKPVARTRADAQGHFTLTPPSLPAGNSEIVLRVPDGKGESLHSTTRVAVVVAPTGDTKPLVAVTSPGKPTLVLSQPEPGATRAGPTGPASRQENHADAALAGGRDAAAPGRDGATRETVPRDPQPGDAGAKTGTGREDGGSSPNAAGSPHDPTRHDPTRIDALAGGVTASPKVVSIDAQDGGKLFVTARGTPGAALRLYLNGTLIAPATVGRDGTVTFTVGRGVQPGDYKVRLDLVDPATGKVRDRAEVPFTAPVPGRDEGVEYSAGGQDPARRADEPERAASGAATPSGEDRADRARTATTGSLAANAPPGEATAPSEVHIPGIKTARIERGDSLWRISRHAYGEGERYTLIYDANKEQIRDPDLIYPGQVFVLPPEQGEEATGDGGPR